MHIRDLLHRSGNPVVREGHSSQRILFSDRWIFFPRGAVEGPMTKKDKIAFIKSSKRKTHVFQDLYRYTDQQLNDVIREIVQGLVRESEIIANAYINGYR
jgi:hypothetical protein